LAAALIATRSSRWFPQQIEKRSTNRDNEVRQRATVKLEIREMPCHFNADNLPTFKKSGHLPDIVWSVTPKPPIAACVPIRRSEYVGIDAEKAWPESGWKMAT
tara:strand:- start:3410 stop:3718 length:309 start_codon:yes stop_codon:yes gene_type:complete